MVPCTDGSFRRHQHADCIDSSVVHKVTTDVGNNRKNGKYRTWDLPTATLAVAKKRHDDPKLQTFMPLKALLGTVAEGGIIAVCADFGVAHFFPHDKFKNIDDVRVDLLRKGFMANYVTWVQHGEGTLEDLSRYALGGYNANNDEQALSSWNDNVVRYERAGYTAQQRALTAGRGKSSEGCSGRGRLLPEGADS
ncbi:hypothetical protein PIB30_046265 [Stylosanthes scabra]|uniref:Uncharacterized protein n=1 Tax=Stylosanthes scabra TaxID=79078 RepID=A0ABU6XEU0_9FABA|nr:hypothetical protein [Stylosanthes scabra]